MRPDISVIIPTYKRPKELCEAIDSVLGQVGSSIEVIVVDDCPNGSAAAVMSSYAGSPVQYFANPTPSGGRPAIVRNIGWPKATGEFLHFLDDDDVVPPGHYARVLATFENAPAIGVVFGAIKPFAGDALAMAHEERYFAQATRRAKQLAWLGPRLGFSAWLLSGSTFVVCSSAVLQREVVIAVSGFNPEIELNEDVDFLLRAIRQGGARLLDSVSINYRIHSSLMHSESDKSPQLLRSYKVIHERYEREHGFAEFFLMKILAGALKFVLC